MAKKQKEIPQEDRTAIIAQALREIRFARNHKQGKVRNWKTNEDLYYSRKISPEASRSNVDLGEMQSYVHTIMAKVDNPLIFKFVKRKNSQLKRVNRLNALRQFDSQRNDWDMKDLAGKKQAVIYGRAIYSYYASSNGGYRPHLGNVDVYDFLIDPSAGGLDMDAAMYLGDYGVSYTKEELETGLEAGDFLKIETQQLIDGSPNNLEMTQETTNKANRTRDTNVWNTNKELTGEDKYKFWRWGTTYKGERYYLLITERGGQAIKIQKLKGMFPTLINPETDQPMWWYWSYAAFIDLTEFWTPSYCDYVREVVMAMAKSVNEGLDNAEAVNKPQKVVNVGAVRDMASLKYRRDGVIKVKKEFDATKAVQFLQVPAIETPIKIYGLLDGIKSRASGVTNGDQGGAANGGDEKVSIYEGNQANSADRFGLFNKSYAFGYKRFGRLYEGGAQEHLVKRVEVEILGPDGIQLESISKSDIFHNNENFNIQTQASNAELALSENEKKLKVQFLTDEEANPNSPQNPKKAYELKAEIVGFEDDDIRQLLDTSEFGDATMLAEADEDIERILDGEKLDPNPIATNAYKARIVRYMKVNNKELSKLEWRALTDYVKSLQSVIMGNMIEQANDVLMKKAMEQAMNPTPPEEAEAPAPAPSPLGGGIPQAIPAGPAVGAGAPVA